MKKYEVFTLTAPKSLSGMKDKLSKDVEQFLNEKASEGYEVVNVSFSYYSENAVTVELVAFITLCK